MTKILVTGASGFLGKALCLSLMEEGYQVRGTYRTSQPQNKEYNQIEWVKVPDLLPTEIWEHPIEGCDIVIHAAARVHQMHITKEDEQKFYRDNTHGTKALVEAVLRSKKIKQFIFVSTILVYGKNQLMPLNRNKECLPDTFYGKSKLAAENIVQNLLNNTSIPWTILRPAVMYGNENKANIASLEKLIMRGIPIPVKGLRNKRSFLSVSNMCKLIISCLLNEKTKNKIFCAADPEVISTEDFVMKLGQSLNKKVRTIRIPFFVLNILAASCDLIQKIGLKSPWNSEVLWKISGNYWLDNEEKLGEKTIEIISIDKNATQKSINI